MKIYQNNNEAEDQITIHKNDDGTILIGVYEEYHSQTNFYRMSSTEAREMAKAIEESIMGKTLPCECVWCNGAATEIWNRVRKELNNEH